MSQPRTSSAPVPADQSAPRPDSGEVRIRPARPEEVARTATIHRHALPSGFFARLGPRFLARYHVAFVASGRARLLVAERGGVVVGFLAGTIDNEAYYRDLLRRRPIGLLVAGMGALLRHPRLAAEFLRTRVGRYGRAVARQFGRDTGAAARTRGPQPTAPGARAAGQDPASPGGGAYAGGDEPTPPVAVLTHVAVTEEARGTGAGRALVEAFTAEVRRARIGEVRLVTERGGPGARFYRRLGWRSRGERRGSDGSLVEEFVRRP